MSTRLMKDKLEISKYVLQNSFQGFYLYSFLLLAGKIARRQTYDIHVEHEVVSLVKSCLFGGSPYGG